MARATRRWRPSEEGRTTPQSGALMDTRETSRGPSYGGSAAGASCASTRTRRPVSRRYTFSRRAPLPPMVGGKTSETTRMPGLTGRF